MRLVRRRASLSSLAALKALAARSGWLLDGPDGLHAGLGPSLLELELAGGRDHTDAVARLGEIELVGEDGPAGSGAVAFATLPFDPVAPGALHVPRLSVLATAEGTWVCAPEGEDLDGLLEGVAAPNQGPQRPRSLVSEPTADEYAHRVAQAVEMLRRKEIDKVVLARSVRGTVPEPLDAAALAERLRQREPACTIYALPTSDGRRFVGASPELLVRREGAVATCHPLAGTIALPAHELADDYERWLLGSAKNLHEHAVVVDEIVQSLSGDFEDIEADPTPSIVTLGTIAHLGSWIRARASGPDTPDALDLVRRLHPTAAVAGQPRDAAYDLLRQLEALDRGHYAGPVGWLDQRGDGEWWIGLRGVVIDGSSFEAWAGAGIVSESDPIAEREETRDKLSVVLSALLLDRIS